MDRENVIGELREKYFDGRVNGLAALYRAIYDAAYSAAIEDAARKVDAEGCPECALSIRALAPEGGEKK